MYANERYWEAELVVHGGVAWSRGKEGLFLGVPKAVRNLVLYRFLTRVQSGGIPMTVFVNMMLNAGNIKTG